MIVLALALTSGIAVAKDREAPLQPETAVVHNATLRLQAQVWRPRGPGPFPAVLFSHGSGHAAWTPSGQFDQRNRTRQAAVLGPVFARHGYVLLFLFRRGAGPSAGQGTYSGDLMDEEFAARGQEGRNRIQVQLLETDEMSDALAGLAYLRALPEVDPQRIAVAGHSFGGSLTLLMAERDPSLRAAISFAGAASSWEGSPLLQARLLAAVGATNVPVLFLHAANDYSVEPARALGNQMRRLGKAHSVKTYPPVGRTVDDGHSFLYLSVATWEADVFAFLDARMYP